MSETPGEVEVVTAERLNTALVAFTGCVMEAVGGLCSAGLTIGETYVPFMPDDEDDCDDEDAYCSQGWVRVESVIPQVPDSWDSGCSMTLSVVIEVGVLRCVTIPEDGEAPTATDVLTAAMQSMDDMNAILCAAMSCDEVGWAGIDAGPWQPLGPLGGQYGGTWTFTAEFT